MPFFPAKVVDPREVATTDEVEEQIVTFDQAARAADVQLRTEGYAIAVFHYVDAGERNTITNVNTNRAARLFDFAQVSATVAVGFPFSQVFANALTSAAR